MAFKLLLLISLAIALSSPQERPPGKRLIKYKQGEPATWMTQEEIDNLFRNHSFGYLDLTRQGVDTSPKTGGKGRHLPDYSYPDHPLQKEVLHDLFHQLEKGRLEKSVRKLSSYPNRHSRLSFGPSSAEGWLKAEIASLLTDYEGSSSVGTVADSDLGSPTPTPGYFPYRQESILVKLEGKDPELKSEIVILGAHYDTMWGMLYGDPNHPHANDTLPGANDNASGVAVLLEVLRILIEYGIHLKYSVEFHFYTAKETGSHGSYDVVAKYKEEKATVRGMLNLDTLGYGESIGYAEETLWNKEWETSEELTRFVKMLADHYLAKKFEVKKFECDPDCLSDHYQWTMEGFHSAFFSQYEQMPNERWHTKEDTVEHVNFELVNEFAKLALAFVVELGELESMCTCGGVKPGGRGWAQVGISLGVVIWLMQ